MRKAFVAGLAAVLVVAAAFVLAPTAWTQARPATPPAPSRPEARMMWLDGRGSSIGVRIQEADTGGVLIDDVEEESPAEKAGLKRGDVIVEFDGERVRGARHFSRLVQETPDGRSVKATIVRDGARQTIDITPTAGERFGWSNDRIIALPEIEREIERGLESLPRNFSFDFDWDASPMIAGGARGRLGARLQPLNGQLAEYFGAKEGVLVASVDDDSPAAKAGLKAGDVIVSVNGRAVNDTRDITQEIRNAEDGKEVELGVLRDRQSLTLKAQIPERRSNRRYTRPA
jgi:S1-C subfamily serine protease